MQCSPLFYLGPETMEDLVILHGGTERYKRYNVSKMYA